MKKITLSLLVLFIMGFVKVTAQVLVKDPKMEYNADSVRAVLDKAPYFHCLRITILSVEQRSAINRLQPIRMSSFS